MFGKVGCQVTSSFYQSMMNLGKIQNRTSGSRKGFAASTSSVARTSPEGTCPKGTSLGKETFAEGTCPFTRRGVRPYTAGGCPLDYTAGGAPLHGEGVPP